MVALRAEAFAECLDRERLAAGQFRGHVAEGDAATDGIAKAAAAGGAGDPAFGEDAFAPVQDRRAVHGEQGQIPRRSGPRDPLQRVAADEGALRAQVDAVAEAGFEIAVRSERAAGLGRRGRAFVDLCAAAEAALDPAVHATVGEALARLIDYQDTRYAERCLALVRDVAALGGGPRLTERFARRLAVWATYEDAIRVADLKTRRTRFERIRAEQGAPPGATLVVTDYLKPDLDEIYGILPAVIARPIARWAERRWPDGRPTIGQHVRTTTVTGFLRVWLLARLRVLRPRSLRAEREWALIERWRAAVRAAGGGPEHIVKLTIYVTDLEAYRNNLGPIGEAWRANMGKVFPAMALLGVVGLVEKEALVEIEATASLP